MAVRLGDAIRASVNDPAAYIYLLSSLEADIAVPA
jgi:hypothetical protein